MTGSDRSAPAGRARAVPAVGPAGARSAPAGRRAVPAIVPAGIGVAWAGLLLAELAGAPVGHDTLAGGTVPLVAAVGIFAVAWAAMVMAMMVPSSYPAIRAFAASIAGSPGEPGRAGRAGRMASFLAGYVAVWTLFGLALFAADVGVHATVDASSSPTAVHGTLTANVLVLAGAFQITRSKRRCLSRCRNPGRLLQSSAAAPPRAACAFRLGRSYGLDCISTCWALMLVVFALGGPHIAWMVLFGGLIVYEKGGRHGVGAAHLAGVAMLAASIPVALS
jgi:predicted metal-binding membrane protein